MQTGRRMDKNELDADNPLDVDTTHTITLLPKGCETPEGAARVQRTMDAWNNTHAEVANRATQFLKLYAATIAEGLKEHAYDVDGALADLKELQELMEDRDSKQEEFLKAVCGRP